MATQKELQIVSLLRERNIKGVDALYDNYAPYLFGIICEIIHMEDMAEHVLQDTFLKVWNKIDTFAFEKGTFLTWILNIARNTAIDMRRSKNYKQTLKLIHLEKSREVRETKVDCLSVEHIDVKDIVNKLDPKYRDLINLVYFNGYTHVEVAKKLNMPLGTVKTRIRKAFQELRKILEA